MDAPALRGIVRASLVRFGQSEDSGGIRVPEEVVGEQVSL